eukprot:TRINITY_DN4426_c0_g1_i2.p1 TRINITY_DN4426_c0_g1~~TRINITY_DN4426_c0_g1_i2.p1  ORF type:complete len:100 (+),score=14.77 TRINITY_DN4426_c0_g1_i2:121-420(+)
MNTTATFSSVLHLQHNPWATPLFVSGPSSHELDTVALWNTSPEDLVRVVALRLASEVVRKRLRVTDTRAHVVVYFVVLPRGKHCTGLRLCGRGAQISLE